MSSKAQSTASRRKPKVRLPSNPADREGASVVVDRRTALRSPVRIGTLSWGISDSWRQSPDEFLSSVASALPSLGSCDLIVSAGLTLTAPPQVEAVLGGSGGTPVLFEADAAEGNRSWHLIHFRTGSPRIALLRQRQLVEKFNHHEGFGRLAEAIASGAGVIRFEGTDLPILLFICGENNLVAPDAAKSVFRRMPDDPISAGRLRELLAGPWAMLNPAHAPYFPPIRSTGFAKVGVVRFEGGEAGPTLRRLVEHKGRYGDGTAGPVAVVHVNNFDVGHPTTDEYAAVTFGDTPRRVRRTRGPATGEVAVASPGATRRWRGSVYELSVQADQTGPVGFGPGETTGRAGRV